MFAALQAALNSRRTLAASRGAPVLVAKTRSAVAFSAAGIPLALSLKQASRPAVPVKQGTLARGPELSPALVPVQVGSDAAS